MQRSNFGRIVATLFVGLLVIGSAAADQTFETNDTKITVPTASPVQFTAFEQYDVAAFEGQFTISGIYRYGYLTNDPKNDAHYGELDLTFVPDHADAIKLPYLRSFGPIKELFFENSAKFVKDSIPQDKLNLLRQRKLYSISGRVTIRVDRYKAWAECGSPYYRVRFLGLEQPAEIRLSRKATEIYGC